MQKHGLPPIKSRCWCCPYQSDAEWLEVQREAPDEFEKACQLDEHLRSIDREKGVYLYKGRVPLREAVFSEKKPDPALQPGLFGEVTGCDSGYCWV